MEGFFTGFLEEKTRIMNGLRARRLFRLGFFRVIGLWGLIGVFWFCVFQNSVLAEIRLTVLHSNDHHGQLLPRGELGGMARFATLVNRIRDEAESNGRYVLLLDAGDVNSGTPESDLFQARPDFLVMNYLKYDYATLGNHEFDPPFEKLLNQIRLAQFPFGAANVLGADGKSLGTPFRIFDFPGCRVAVLGIALSNESIMPKSEGKFLIRDEVQTARETVRFLREEKKTELIIAVTHLGFVPTPGARVTSEQFAEAVDGIDLIVDGHSHTKMDQPRWVRGIPLVSAGERSCFLGEARLVWNEGRVTDFSWKCHLVDRRIPEDLKVNEILRPFVEATAQKMKRSVMKTAIALPGGALGRRKQTALGQLIADGMVQTLKKEGFPCDFAFINGGNVRAGLPEGNVTLGDWFSVLPFKNEIHLLELEGRTVLEVFDFVATLPEGAAAYPQLSREIRCVLEQSEDGTKSVKELTLNGTQIKPEGRYFLAVTDFIAAGGDRYDALLKSLSLRKTGCFLLDSIVEHVQTLPQPVAPEVEARLILKEKE